jgi:hypothetical protein
MSCLSAYRLDVCVDNDYSGERPYPGCVIALILINGSNQADEKLASGKAA